MNVENMSEEEKAAAWKMFQHQALVSMLDAANSRIAELEGQLRNTAAVLRDLGMTEEKVGEIILELCEVSGLNAKRQEVSHIKADLAAL